MTFKGDFHIHSCLSPCAHISMTPNEVAKALKKVGVEWAAVTDHNSCGNVKVFEKVFSKYDIALLPGVEVQTKEEVHVLVYLKNVETAMDFSQELEIYLPKRINDPEKFGYQLYVDECDRFIAMEEKMLSLSVNLSIYELWKLVKRYDGLFVYAHVLRKFGIVHQLGFIPDSPIPDALEYRSFRGKDMKFAVLSSSDAHFLTDISSAHVEINAEKRDFDDFKNALNERKVRIL